MMSDPRQGYIRGGGIAKALFGAIVAVIFAGVAMQLVAVVMLAVPNVSFDASNPAVVYPAFYIALVIMGIGAGITLAGCRPVIRFSKRASELIGSLQGTMTGSNLDTAAAPAIARGASTGPTIIRPALVKKEAAELTASAPAPPAEARPKPVSPAKAQETPAKEIPASSSGPADQESVTAALNMITERYEKPDVRSKFNGWVNDLVMAFPDINKSYVFTINGSEGISMVEGANDAAAVQVTMASDMFVKLLNKQINAIKAYSSGALKVKGEMKNLLKLRKLMF